MSKSSGILIKGFSVFFMGGVNQWFLCCKGDVRQKIPEHSVKDKIKNT